MERSGEDGRGFGFFTCGVGGGLAWRGEVEARGDSEDREGGWRWLEIDIRSERYEGFVSEG